MGWELSWNSFSLYISLPNLSHQFWWLKMSPVCQWLLNYISNQKCLSNSRLINPFASSTYLLRCQNRPLKLNMFITKHLISPIFQKKKKQKQMHMLHLPRKSTNGLETTWNNPKCWEVLWWVRHYLYNISHILFQKGRSLSLSPFSTRAF